MADTLPNRILVTGGLGFIGHRLSAHLADAGVQVRILDDLSNACFGEDKVSALGADVHIGDVRDPDACARAIDGADAVVHLAAQTGVLPSVDAPRTDLEINGHGVLNMLEACRVAGVRQMLCASSNAVVGHVDPPIHEGMMQAPVSPYGATKLLSESYCRSYAEIHGLRSNALRFSNVYGPGSRKKGSVVAKFIKDAMAGRPLTIFGDGKQTRDFLYIDDLIAGIVACLTTDLGGEVLCLGTGRPVTINELARTLREQFNQVTGTFLRIEHQPARPGESVANYSDPAKARRLLGFEADTPLETGLMNTLSWFLESDAEMERIPAGGGPESRDTESPNKSEDAFVDLAGNVRRPYSATSVTHFEPIEIACDRILLKPFCEDYVTDKYVNWMNDSELMKFSENRHRHHDHESCRQYIKSVRASGFLFWAIFDKSGKEHIGNILAMINYANAYSEMAVLIGDRAYAGQGYGREAWAAVMQYLLETCKLRKIESGTMEVNRPMLKIMEATGMVEEGRRREHFVFDGRAVDYVLMAKFRERA